MILGLNGLTLGKGVVAVTINYTKGGNHIFAEQLRCATGLASDLPRQTQLTCHKCLIAG